MNLNELDIVQVFCFPFVYCLGCRCRCNQSRKYVRRGWKYPHEQKHICGVCPINDAATVHSVAMDADALAAVVSVEK